MNMQDNELDELFRTKLNGVEIEPSAHVWGNIAGQLGHKKKSLVPALSIAATILVLLAAGTWFVLDRPTEVKQNTFAQRKPAKPSVLIQKPVAVPAQQRTDKPAYTSDVNEPVIARVSTQKHLQQVNKQQPTAEINPTAEKEEPAKSMLAMNESPSLLRVVPDGQLTLKIIDTTPVTLKSLNPAPIIMASQPVKKKKHGIHSLGDLINVVVAQVDKREDKLIEFTDTDDEDTKITGLNLGIIRVKKENK